MFCTQCGTEINAGQNFCRGCGARVAPLDPSSQAPLSAPREPAGTVETSSSLRQPMPVSPTRDRAGSKKAVIIAAAAVMVVLAAAGVYMASELMRQSAPEQTQIVDARAAQPDAPAPSEEGKNAGAADNTAPSSLFESIPPEPAAPPRPGPLPKPAQRVQAPSELRPPQFRPADQDAPASSRARGSSPAVSAARRGANPGIYQTTRATSVFESPSASAKVVADIPSGVRVNVVSTSGDWLEVHSRRGNPPGFIRREDAQFVETGQ